MCHPGTSTERFKPHLWHRVCEHLVGRLVHQREPTKSKLGCLIREQTVSQSSICSRDPRVPATSGSR